jgi:aminoglycoside phosphotransferase family enzyme/predicted kinase
VSHGATPREIIDFFLDPRNYDHEVDRVGHAQTHVSHLFFAGDYVYKVKKPVNLGFLDFSTLDKRRAAAIAELDLNRRVAPAVYIDLAAVHRDGDGRLSFSAPAMVEEVAVVMKRLPAEQRLSKLIEAGAATADMMRDLGRLVADFHSRAATSPQIAEYGSLATIRHNWDENFEQTRPYLGRTLTHGTWQTCKDEIERFMRAYADLFQQRVANGWIRDCHGDLQTDDIFIDPATGSAQVLDCIEFNDRFRYSDTVADIAFLSMDLRNRGRDDLAEAFLAAYDEASSDERSLALLRFYESYRAYVRGKVRSFVLDQTGPSEEEKTAATQEARRFFEQSLDYARRLRPRLILVCGLMGSGKTRQALELARMSGTRVVHSDVTRKRLAGLDPEEQQRVPFGTGIYSADWSERTYRTLVNEARSELARGNSIILDASWSNSTYRSLARDAAAEREALFGILECTAPEPLLRSRLSKPGRHITDGRIELLDDQRAAYVAPSAEEAELLVQIDTSGDFERAATRAYETFFAESAPGDPS